MTAAWLKAVRDEVAARPEYRRRSMEDIRLAAFEDALRRCGPDRLDVAKAVYESFMQARFAKLELYPDVREALMSLGQTHRLALVTNGNTYPERVGLDELLDVVVVAFDCGHYKPDPEIYRYAVRRLGVAPAACLHVGDHPIEDVRAAQQAGLRTAWINRDGSRWELDITPDIVISNLSELPSYL
jgi:putative hydrolase of the HAD superfamily